MQQKIIYSARKIICNTEKMRMHHNIFSVCRNADQKGTFSTPRWYPRFPLPTQSLFILYCLRREEKGEGEKEETKREEESDNGAEREEGTEEETEATEEAKKMERGETGKRGRRHKLINTPFSI